MICSAVLSPKANSAFVFCLTVVTEASTSCSTEQLGSCFLQKASPEVVPENASSVIPSGQGESQPWAEVGTCNVLWGRILVAKGLLSFEISQGRAGSQKV